ncbi:UDP-N-acetylenolpyruvoylglucosamine reductase [Andreprevotia sp. IGB-42]|uniref:UDP-N-acetylmuramate dehydrogenase n=1 Tax=Andreprevotia sp. IGB-42 TaxID=2497473 RepID=UPI001358C816|nr:UDP-N-acetylmuramate dehydrogenase [Andreprevotia sp. IGB-42]KAF0814555.1 UDP-N-acetylenolpyruvoylglucosamine reductase [Andreprevotia sp. IGB-42]
MPAIHTAIHTDVALTMLNTLGLTAHAAQFTRITSVDDLQALLADASLRTQPWHVLGGGSNLVLPEVVDGLTLRVEIPGRRLIGEDEHAVYVAAGGGENWHQFVQWTLQQGWGGLENLSLIPGTVGAAPIQNIGAYGVEVKDHLFELTAYSLDDGRKRVFSNADCGFAYRDSVFKRAEAGRWLIAEVVFRLPRRPTLVTSYGDIDGELASLGLPRTPQGVARAVIAVRQRKLPDPAQIGNAGSFFKNPIVPETVRDALLAEHPQLVSYPAGAGLCKLAAGWLIEQTGWKGKQLGPVGMYARQALVLVNHGGAVRHDVAELTAAVQVDVAAQFGVVLEPEPVWW